jgi:hypothetical protein
VETAVTVSGPVIQQAPLSLVKGTPPLTPVVAVAYWSERQGSAAEIVMMVPSPVVLTASRSTAAAILKSMNAMVVVSWKRHLADSAANAVKASGPVI